MDIKKEEILKALEEAGGRIVRIEPSKQIEGVEIVSYQLQKLDRAGIGTGEYRNNVFKKSIYDTRIISTDSYIKRGLEAANNLVAINTNGSRIGIDSDGVTWIYFVDEYGKVSTFYPSD